MTCLFDDLGGLSWVQESFKTWLLKNTNQRYLCLFLLLWLLKNMFLNDGVISWRNDAHIRSTLQRCQGASSFIGKFMGTPTMVYYGPEVLASIHHQENHHYYNHHHVVFFSLFMFLLLFFLVCFLFLFFLLALLFFLFVIFPCCSFYSSSLSSWILLIILHYHH